MLSVGNCMLRPCKKVRTGARLNDVAGSRLMGASVEAFVAVPASKNAAEWEAAIAGLEVCVGVLSQSVEDCAWSLMR